MPKLKDKVIEQNQWKIEAAALRVFTRQGYHGTSVRDIAEAAGVSIGNLYNYYGGKEEIFLSLVRRYEVRMDALRGKVLGPMDNVFDPAELQRLAKGIREIVYENPDYWRLMYIDVVEFGSQHFAHTYRSLAHSMKQRLGPRLREATRRGPWNEIDPALAFTAIYLQFFTYFLVEKLFGGKQHLGMPDDRAIAQLIRMQTQGIWRNGAADRGSHDGDTRRRK
jgi:TetR/AcrR family transcriptional regulator, acrAB operon repressor